MCGRVVPAVGRAPAPHAASSSQRNLDACCRATVCLPHDPYLTTGCFSSQEWLAKLPAMEMDEEPLIPTALYIYPLHLD